MNLFGPLPRVARSLLIAGMLDASEETARVPTARTQPITSAPRTIPPPPVPGSNSHAPRGGSYPSDEEARASGLFVNVMSFSGVLSDLMPIDFSHSLVPEWRGTRLASPPASAPSDLASIQRLFAHRMRENDPAPPARLLHFDWIRSTRYGRLKQVWFEGWAGWIETSRLREDGKWLFRVWFIPVLRCPGEPLHTWDRVIESWSFDPGTNEIELLDSDASTVRRDYRRFRCAIYQD